MKGQMNSFEILDRYRVTVSGREEDHYECRVEVGGGTPAHMAEAGIRMIKELASSLLGRRMEFILVDGYRIFSEQTPGYPITVDMSIAHVDDGRFGVSVEATDDNGVIFELSGILTSKEFRSGLSDIVS